jgi:type 1 glutamine amidotransferase
MKLHMLTPGFLLCLLVPAVFAAPTSGGVLEKFANYEQGKPLAVLIDTRRAVFAGTDDAVVRSERERELLAFIAADAHPQAKAIAIEWLGCMGSPACVPALIAVGKDPALTAPVAAAIERIRGPAAKQPGAPAISKQAAEVAGFTSALAADSASRGADDRIAAAILSSNNLLANSALRQIRSGAGTPALPGELLAALDQVPASRRMPLCEALAPRADAAETLRSILLPRIKSGDPESRAAAVKVLGRILRPADLPMVLELATDTATPGLSVAATAAISRATDAEIDATLIRLAREETAIRIAAIDALAARNALAAVGPLWSLTSEADPKVATAAYEALGTLLPPDHLNEVLQKLTAAHGSPSGTELGKLLWNVIRRHPDPAAAARFLADQAASSPAGIKQLLTRYAERIRPKNSAQEKPKPKPKLDLPKAEDRAQLMPDGHEQLAYLDCGTSDQTQAKDLIIRKSAGQSHQFGDIAHPLATMDFGKTITYEVTGLEAGAQYVIGFSAWDADLGGRRQSFSVNDTVLLDGFAPLAYHADQPTYTRIHLPLPAPLTACGKISVNMRSLAGPNAVISELWLLRRQPDATGKKQVLILTGDDFKGHRWRETGPEFAAILRADPRLEVTISESPYLLDSPVLSTYDSVLLHFKNYENRLPTGESLWKNLETYVHGGGGLVIAHFGCGAMQEWNGFVKVAGRVWDPKERGHDPYGEFLVRILQTGHPATEGLTDFKTRDELYTCLAGDAGIDVLAEATSKVDQSVQPMAFVLTPGKGRVFHSPLGHDLGALEAQGLRNLYLQATRWTAGLTP